VLCGPSAKRVGCGTEGPARTVGVGRAPSTDLSLYREDKMLTTQLGTKIHISDIKTDDRIRQDYGDIDALANSIKEHGLIQTIVLTYKQNPEEIRLLVGGRRLRALSKLGLSTLIHGEHFLWSGETDPLRTRGIELEENIRRHQLSWQEQVLAKQKLLEVMVQIHGASSPGQPSTMSRLGGSPQGFGVNKLAAMLGESNAATSKDLELARLISAIPQLRSAETKEAARRLASLGVAVATSTARQAAAPTTNVKNWTLYEGDFNVNAVNITDATVDLVIVDPPYGEDVQGMAANSRDLLANPFADSFGDCAKMVGSLGTQSYRVLRPDSFAVFFFGFSIYGILVDALRQAGFDVDLTPVVWIKNNVINTSPYTRYGRSYEPSLIARKGSPKLMRPSQRDVIQMDTVQASGGAKWYHAQKPVALIEKFILDMTAPGATIVDFCAGSGTAGEASLKNKRKVVLFEKDPTACQIIKSRLGALP
jgi:adenine-specific DNA-methyltransferase